MNRRAIWLENSGTTEVDNENFYLRGRELSALRRRQSLRCSAEHPRRGLRGLPREHQHEPCAQVLGRRLPRIRVGPRGLVQYLRATGWDESSSRGRTGDTELTRTNTKANFGCVSLLHRRSSSQLFFTRQRLPHESAEGKDKLRKISEVLFKYVRRVLSCQRGSSLVGMIFMSITRSSSRSTAWISGRTSASRISSSSMSTGIVIMSTMAALVLSRAFYAGGLLRMWLCIASLRYQQNG